MPPTKKVQPACKHRGCKRDQATRGYCKPHYNQWRQWGCTFDLLPRRGNPTRPPTDPCAAPACEDPSTLQTVLCKRHGKQDSAFRHKYGIGLLERLAQEAAVDGCPICGGRPDKLHLDHNHETGEHRGYICGPCNRAIGLMQDDPARLRAAADYLERIG